MILKAFALIAMNHGTDAIRMHRMVKLAMMYWLQYGPVNSYYFWNHLFINLLNVHFTAYPALTSRTIKCNGLLWLHLKTARTQPPENEDASFF
jgi:hypothetical protein